MCPLKKQLWPQRRVAPPAGPAVARLCSQALKSLSAWQEYERFTTRCWAFQAADRGARARPPETRLRLRPRDVRQALLGKHLLLLWPEDGRWWPGTVTALRVKERRATLLYDTGARCAVFCEGARAAERRVLGFLAWPGTVLALRSRERRVALLYDTGARYLL